MNKYRIKKIEESYYGDHYIIQKRTRFLEIGPHIWETWDYYEGCWRYLERCGYEFDDLERAKEELRKIIRRESNEIVSNETVIECNTLNDLK